MEVLRSEKGGHGFYRSETIPAAASQSHYKLHNDAIGKAANKELQSFNQPATKACKMLSKSIDVTQDVILSMCLRYIF